MRHIQEEGRIPLGEFLDEVDGVIGDGVGVVEVFGNVRDRFTVLHQAEGIEEVDDAPDRAPVLLKTSPDRIGVGIGKAAEVEVVADP